MSDKTEYTWTTEMVLQRLEVGTEWLAFVNSKHEWWVKKKRRNNADDTVMTGKSKTESDAKQCCRLLIECCIAIEQLADRVNW